MFACHNEQYAKRVDVMVNFSCMQGFFSTSNSSFVDFSLSHSSGRPFLRNLQPIFFFYRGYSHPRENKNLCPGAVYYTVGAPFIRASVLLCDFKAYF